jgi:uncharacterized protein (DUF1778 family)
MMKKASAFALGLLCCACRGAATAAQIVIVATTVTACADENNPKTWVKRLDDPARRAPSIKRLEQFFNDTMSRDSNNRR